MNLKDIQYDAFISYRHVEPDSFIAQTLHRKLEAFRFPRSARDKAGSGKTKIERIFRDEEELPLSEDLSEPINNALANSEYLICICTPRYLESKWCMREIELFLQTHDRDHILVVLAEGEPEESFPALLTQGGREPLAADTRGVTKKEIITKLNTAVLRISAAMFGLNFDDLRQRHREAKLKRLMVFGGAIGVAVLAFAVFATVTLVKISRQNVEISEQNREISKQKDTISTQYSDLQEKYAEKTVESAGQLLGKGRREDAIKELKSVLPDSKDKPYNVNVMRLLYDALGIYRVNNQLVPVQIYESDRSLNMFDVSVDGKYILLRDESKVSVSDSDSKEVLYEIERQS
ncbi:MAG: TIR domain-containing protein, partial [Eubacterium sp.]|nr:TIR domain-containing protein [Eubacterium sp.]